MEDYFFPLDTGEVSWDSTIAENWEVEVATTASGKRRTLCQQVMPGWDFSVTFPALNKSQVDELLRFYASMKGPWKSFWYMDYEYHHVDNAIIGKVDANNYQCLALIGSYAEPAGKVKDLTLYVDGLVIENRDLSDGKFFVGVDAGTVVTATYDYYFRVCFKDPLQIKQVYKDVFSVNINLSVVRE